MVPQFAASCLHDLDRLSLGISCQSLAHCGRAVWHTPLPCMTRDVGDPAAYMLDDIAKYASHNLLSFWRCLVIGEGAGLGLRLTLLPRVQSFSRAGIRRA